MQKVFFAILTLAAFQGSEQRVKCVLESKYFIPNFTANWFKATEYCHYLGMRLAVISSSVEQANLVAMIRATDKFSNSSTDIWIGGSDLADEGDFYWHSTGTRILHTNWKKNQPDNANKNEHCVEIRFIPAHGWDWHWNDRDCKAARYFVCENTESTKEIVLF